MRAKVWRHKNEQAPSRCPLFTPALFFFRSMRRRPSAGSAVRQELVSIDIVINHRLATSQRFGLIHGGVCVDSQR